MADYQVEQPAGSRKRRSPPWLTPAATFLDASAAKVFTRRDLGTLLAQHRQEWAAPQSLTQQRFIETLTQDGKLRTLDIQPVTTPASGRPEPYKPFVRCVWGEANPYAIALSLRSGAYLSHASAVFIHGLTQDNIKTIYVNKEQSVKPAAEPNLSQTALDRGVQNNARTFNYILAPTATISSSPRQKHWPVLSGRNIKRPTTQLSSFHNLEPYSD